MGFLLLQAVLLLSVVATCTAAAQEGECHDCRVRGEKTATDTVGPSLIHRATVMTESAAFSVATTTTSTSWRPSPEVLKANLRSGEAFTANFSIPAHIDDAISLQLESPPAGLSINKRSGVLNWHPDVSQAGEHKVVVVAKWSSSPQVARYSITLTVAAGQPNPPGLYVWPAGGSNEGGAGTAADPFESIEYAAGQAKAGDTIYVRGGHYTVKDIINVKATAKEPVVITRLPGERVRFTSEPNNNCFYVPENSIGLRFRGFEFDGGSDQDDHWEILKTSWWQLADARVGAKMAFDIDGQHVTVEDCVIHNFAQKGVNVKLGRYVTVQNNVIKNIAHTSLSGGHGIMRQWKNDFDDADDPNHYRFDFYGNLIIAVEQRIYSFIPKKAYCHMVLDEGKAILVDESHDKKMKARIAHNLILYPGVTGVKLKWNSNMEVLNNAVIAEEGRVAPVPDGISAVKKPNPIPNMIVGNNLAHTYAGGFAFDVSDHFEQAGSANLFNNFFSGGGSDRRSRPGLTDIGSNVSVFRDAAAHDFQASRSLPPDVGVDKTLLERMMGLASEYSVSIESSGWRHDHARMVKTIVENAPEGHVKFDKIAKSEHDEHKDALWYNVVSEEYRELCNCNKIELIPPNEYWAEVQTR